MPRPGNSRLRKTAWHVAVRELAVQAAREAFPALSPGELGAALGISRHQVRWYLLARGKTDRSLQPAWAQALLAGCRHLRRGETTQAALELQGAALLIDGEGNPARKR